MSDTHLPSDVQQWPSNPFEVLGVTPKTDRRDIRRAYLRLIRVFKPDDAPDAFQRIHEAHELVKQIIEARSRLSVDEVPSELAESTTLDNSSNPSNLVSDLSDSGPVSASRLDEGTSDQTRQADAWEIAKSGRLSDAYARLVHALRDNFDDSDTYLRLYWLLVCDPSLDADRVPRAWLIDGLRNTNYDYQLGELYRRELEREPANINDETADLLVTSTNRIDVLGSLLIWRWQAFFRLGYWSPIVRDLETVRKVFVFDADDAWARLVIKAMSFLAFSDDPFAFHTFETLKSELTAIDNVHTNSSREFDDLDALLLLIADWNRIRSDSQLPKTWIEVVPFGWLDMYDAVRAKASHIVHEMVQHPHHCLQILDRFAAKSTMVLDQFVGLIHAYRVEADRSWPSRPDDEIEKLVRQFAYPRWSSQYVDIRSDFMDLCLAETVHPDVLARWLGSIWSQEIMNDLPLRVVCLANSAFDG